MAAGLREIWARGKDRRKKIVGILSFLLFSCLLFLFFFSPAFVFFSQVKGILHV